VNPILIPCMTSDSSAPMDISELGLHILLNKMHEEYEAYQTTFSAMMTICGLKYNN
jgi:hypothetical protein